MCNREVFLVTGLCQRSTIPPMPSEQTHTLQISSVRCRNVALVCDAIAAETSRTRDLFSLLGHVI